ncbi:hypothetical protein Q8A67_024768 [Cirrhinus molitorella]|uniref:Ig-like domain-containing protein n=1 Tax=Cirrhinus molitorella TaxID=172907 RepID=A0AA88T9R3_9TELE|nr:hypothetical protein Q8A67_024768 [Cirrhinus molitorella]
MEIRWSKGTETIYQYNNGQEMTNNDFENRVSLSSQELRRGNLALTLRNVQMSDSGDYTCTVFHDGCQKRGVVHLQVREIERLTHLWSVLKQAHEDITQQRVKLNETIKLLEETLNHIELPSKHKNSIEGIPPFMQDHGRLEGHSMEDRRAVSTCKSRSAEAILPHLDEECDGQRTIQTREEVPDTEQEVSSPETSSRVLQTLRRSEFVSLRERATQTQVSPEATIQSTQEMRQQTVEQENFPQAVQPQATVPKKSHPLVWKTPFAAVNGKKWVFHRCLRCAEILKMAEKVPETGQGPFRRRSNSREGLPPFMAEHDDGQNRSQTSEGNTDTQQEFQPVLQTQNVQSDISGESDIVPRSARSYEAENPGTSVQSIAREQEGSSPPVQSQVPHLGIEILRKEDLKPALNAHRGVRVNSSV